MAITETKLPCSWLLTHNPALLCVGPCCTWSDMSSSYSLTLQHSGTPFSVSEDPLSLDWLFIR